MLAMGCFGCEILNKFSHQTCGKIIFAIGFVIGTSLFTLPLIY